MTATLADPMPRPATGTVETHAWKDGKTVTIRLRVPAYGRRYRIDLGTNHQGWSVERGQVELDRIMEKVRRGTWEPPEKQASEPERAAEAETLHTLLARWWLRKKVGLEPKTIADYEWRIGHILQRASGLRDRPVGEIDARTVDTFIATLQARGLKPRGVNMVVGLLAQVLDDAVRYDLLPANPARGKGTRVKQPTPTRSFLEPDMVLDLLDEAGAWEREINESTHPNPVRGRRPLLATLCLAGPRINEALPVPLSQLDIHAGTMVLGSKTAAGRGRTLELSAFLLGELRAHLASIPATLRDRHGQALPIFHTANGRRHSYSNVNNRLLRETVRRVNERRAAEGRMLLPHTTPHALRRTWASLCFFAGRDLRWVMSQGGWADPSLVLAVYAQAMSRSRVDYDLAWRLMRFPDEEETPWTSRRSASSATSSSRTGLTRSAAGRSMT